MVMLHPNGCQGRIAHIIDAVTNRDTKNSRLAERFLTFDGDSCTTARRLLGQRLVHIVNGQRLAGTIVEVEAYLGSEDKAAHTYNGRRTARNKSMYLPGGHLYVYFTYGMHHCMNIVCGKPDVGVAVLIRAIDPTEGIEMMFAHRKKAKKKTDLCSGPAKLAEALAIDLRHDGTNLRTDTSLFLEQLRKRRVSDTKIDRTPRIGVDYSEEWAVRPLRFCIRGNAYLSRKSP